MSPDAVQVRGRVVAVLARFVTGSGRIVDQHQHNIITIQTVSSFVVYKGKAG